MLKSCSDGSTNFAQGLEKGFSVTNYLHIMAQATQVGTIFLNYASHTSLSGDSEER